MSEKRSVSTETSLTYPSRYEDSWVGDELRSLYVHDTKKNPLISAAEIAQLSQLVQDGIAATARLDGLETIIDTDELEALENTKMVGQDARNEIIVANTGLVFKWATHYEGLNVDYLDLVQAGNLGLIRAAEKFDPSKGFTFGTYATTWIKSFISEEVHKSKRTIRVEPSVSAQMQKLQTIITRHQAINGGDMTLLEMAQAMNKTEKQVTELLAWDRKTISMNTESDESEGNSTEYADSLVDRDAVAVEDIALDEVAKQSIVSAIHGLLSASTVDEDSKEIIRMEYGIGYDKPKSRREISRVQGAREEKVKRLAEEAMEQLRIEASLFEMNGLLDS